MDKTDAVGQTEISGIMELTYIDKKLRRNYIKWSCSNFVNHVHRWKWSAWLCGGMQYLKYKFKKKEME